MRDGAHFAVIVGDELAEGQVQLRDLDAASQKRSRSRTWPRSCGASRRAS